MPAPKIIHNPLISLATPNIFPRHWLDLLDGIIPGFVKDRFSPKDSWKGKPFTDVDMKFFAKGLIELSEFFTTDREGSKLPTYFTAPKFRSSYFLYFFALQGAKFISLFERYDRAMDAMLAHGKKNGELRIIDVGSGPGTASLALLAWLLDRFDETRKLPFPIKLLWIDRNDAILKDGEALLNAWLAHLAPHWDGDISLETEARDWWRHPKDFNPRASIILFGNVLNETSQQPAHFLQGLSPLLENPEGAGILFIEPAFKAASQRLSQIRDEWVERGDAAIWGPCLHLGRCPLAFGRDWCHFSVPTELPGKWFRKFSIQLGGIRDWLKFSFTWLAAAPSLPLTPASENNKSKSPLYRVISDTLKTESGKQNQICEPERVGYVSSPPKPLFRGDLTEKMLLKGNKKNDPVFQSKNKKDRSRKSPRWERD
jgi:hypothetical protein